MLRITLFYVVNHWSLFVSTLCGRVHVGMHGTDIGTTHNASAAHSLQQRNNNEWICRARNK